MHYTYKTKGTCSSKIEFDVKDDRIYNVIYTGGCNGNLKAIASLVEGEKIDTVIEKLKNGENIFLLLKINQKGIISIREEKEEYLCFIRKIMKKF